MTNNVNDLSVRLSQAGIPLNEPTSPAQLQTPWFVRALQAFSGWLAALFLLGFIAMGVVFMVESPAASLGLGLVMIGAAYGLFCKARGDVLEHLALAVSLAGQLLIAWALVEFWNVSTYLWWSLLALQCALALVMPSQVHRTFSAFAASLALYMALAVNTMAPAAGGLVLLALALLWLNEFRCPGRIQDVQAWGYGLLIGLLVMQGLAHSGHSFAFWFDAQSTNAFAWSAPWLNAVLVALSLALLLYTIPHSKTHWGLYLSPLALLLVSFYAPSVGQGLVVVLLGFAIGHRLVLGLGVLSLLMGIGSYYYWLDATLLTKALTLLVLGGGLLALRWTLLKWLSVAENSPSTSMMLKAKRNRWIIVLTTVVVLVAVNWAIWQKEHHLAEGEIVYLELAPVDPRSLMQGDYMALNFALGNQIQSALHQSERDEDSLKTRNGHVVVRLDEQRIAHFQRLDEGTSLRDDEQRLRYRLRNGQVRFATDAFFFQEGYGERYEPARYGQFRVNTKGEPLLVALYNAELTKLGESVK